MRRATSLVPWREARNRKRSGSGCDPTVVGFGGRLQDQYVRLLSTGGLWVTLILQVVALSVAYVAGPEAGTDDAAIVAVIWQVHAAFASIGFAGLAIAFQVLGDPPLTAGSARQSVVSDLRFGRLLVSGVLASIIIGSVSIWAASPGTIAVSFILVLAPSVLLVGSAYARLAILFTSSQRIEGLTLAELKDRVSRASKTAAQTEQDDRSTEVAIDTSRGLTSNSLSGGVALPVRRVAFSGYRATLVAVNVGPMVHAADYLAWAAHLAESGSGPTSYEYPQRVSVRARPNREYRAGDTLFEMHEWPGIDEKTWQAITRQLLSGLRFSQDRSNDARLIFAEEMSSLQDSILAAVRDQQMARVERGYLYYHQTVHDARDAALRAQLGLRDARWFEKQLWEIDEAAARASDRMAFVAIGDAERMAHNAIKTEDLAWLALALTRLQHLWSGLLEAEPLGARHARENLLVAMQNLAEFAIPHSFSNDTEAAYASRQMIWTFVSVAKDSIERGEASAQRVLGYMGGLYDLSSRPTAERLGVEIAAGQAAILGWVLFSAAERGVTLSVPLSWFPKRHYPPDLVLVLRAFEAYRDDAPWRHWETADALPFRAQVLRFEHYYRQAVLLLAANGNLRIRGATADADDRYLLSATADSVEATADYWGGQGHEVSGLQQVSSTLRDIVTGIDAVQMQRLATSPLSQTRLDEFTAAVVDTLTSGPRLSAFLALGEPDTWDKERLLGHELGGIPKQFFAETDSVAFTSDLGHQVGAAVLRGQDVAIVDVLLAGQDVAEVPSDGLRTRVDSLAKDYADPVIVYNGQSDVEELLGLDFRDNGDVTLAGHPAFALFVGASNLRADLLLADREQLHRVGFRPEPKDGLHPLDGVALAIGVWDSQGEQATPTVMIEYGQIMGWSDSSESRVVGLRIAHTTEAQGPVI